MTVAIVNIIILNNQGDIDRTVGFQRLNLRGVHSDQLCRRLRSSRGTERSMADGNEGDDRLTSS